MTDRRTIEEAIRAHCQWGDERCGQFNNYCTACQISQDLADFFEDRMAECQARLKESEAENWALRQRVERYVKWFGDEDDPYDDCRVQLGGRCKCGDGKHGDLAAPAGER